jgi:hypothetical protein
MQNLSKLLRKLATISILLNSMQNRAVAYFLANRVKQASQFINADFVDIADIVSDYIADAKNGDFCPEDIQRLRVLGTLLLDANVLLHKVQNTVLAA